MKVSHFNSQHEAGRLLGFGQGNIGAIVRGERKYTNGYWFVNADDKAADLTKRKLHEIGKIKLTAADEASADFVSQVISE